MKGKLYLVPIPIGNKDDITLRALKTLRESDFVICEEFKTGKKLLDSYNIENELFSINEHNEKENSQEIINLLLEGKSAALISDAGSPLFSDPGHYLVNLCVSYKIDVIPLPGANSLVPALMGSDMDTEKFYYYGWLSPKKNIRRKELFELKKRRDLLVFMETPYRLIRLLEDCSAAFGSKTPGVLAYKISMPEEKFIRGTLGEILSFAKKNSLKGEFVLLVNNRPKGKTFSS